MTLVGFVAAWAYSRFEHGVPDGHVLHWLYWVGLWPTRGRTMRNPYRRLLLP
jgi:conjugal transfer pilus assembly protein TraL